MVSEPPSKVALKRLMTSLLYVGLFTSGLLTLVLLGFPPKLVLGRYVGAFLLTIVGLPCMIRLGAFLYLMAAVLLDTSTNE
jgi:hypothetical protein